MSVEHIIDKKRVPIKDKDYIEILSKKEDGYTWDEVYYKNDELNQFIGSYYTYNYSSSREWMEMNDKYIAFMRQCTFGYDVYPRKITALFDIEAKAHVKGTEEDLEYFYKLSLPQDKSLKKTKKNTNIS